MKTLQKNLLKASFIGTFAEGMFTPIWAAITERVGGTILDAGLGFCLFSIVTGLTVILAGRTKWFKDNTPLVVFLGFALAGIGDILYIFATNKWELFAVQSFVGLCIGLLGPAWDTLYTEDEANVAEKWSFWTGGVSFVIGLSALIGGLIVEIFGYTALFLSMAFFDVFAIYFAFKVYKNSRLV